MAENWASLINHATAQAIPPVISGYIGTYLGFGICKYQLIKSTSAFAMTGSAQTFYFTINQSHRFLRFQATQSVISTGVNDTTGINLTLQKTDYYLGGQGDIQASTNGNQAVATVIFDFGASWENPASTYIIGATGQNNDQLTVEFYIQYLSEPENSTATASV